MAKRPDSLRTVLRNHSGTSRGFVPGKKVHKKPGQKADHRGLGLNVKRVVAVTVMLVMVSVIFTDFVQKALADGGGGGGGSPGEWVVSSDTYLANETRTTTLNVTVKNGAILSLNDSVLELQRPSPSVKLTILVEPGGTFDARRSEIRSNDSTKRYDFIVKGNLLLQSSTVKHLDGTGTVGGIQLFTPNATLVDTRIENSTVAIYGSVPLPLHPPQ